MNQLKLFDIENWKDIEGYDGVYQVSNLGKVRSVRGDKVRMIRGTLDRGGYRFVFIKHKGLSKNHKVHRLVASAFIPNNLNKPQVNHIDSDRSNNDINNLEWCTAKENMRHASRKGNEVWRQGFRRVLKKNDVIKIIMLLKLGVAGEELARMFKTTPQNISMIRSKKRWKSLQTTS